MLEILGCIHSFLYYPLYLAVFGQMSSFVASSLYGSTFWLGINLDKSTHNKGLYN